MLIWIFFQEEALIIRTEAGQSISSSKILICTYNKFILIGRTQQWYPEEDYEKVSIVDIEIWQSGSKHFFEGKNTEDISSNF